MELIATIERACGRTARLNMLPMQDGDVPATCADIAAISDELGYRPATGIAIGVPRFVDWFRYFGPLGGRSA